MIRRVVLVGAVSVLFVAALAPLAMADEGGLPGAHGADGGDFGPAVADLAASGPGAVADHIADQAGGDQSGDVDAYGKMIQETFGAPYGEILVEYRAAFEDGGYEGPHGETEPLAVVGAKAFWLAHAI